MAKKPCGHDDCSCSTGIADETTFGRGKLDDNGYWEIPCAICARSNESRDGLPVGTYWPFENKEPEFDKGAKIKEATELGDKLFTLANEFALAGEGDVAVLLHAASNDTRRAKSQLEGVLSAAKLNMIIRTEMMVNSVLMGEG